MSRPITNAPAMPLDFDQRVQLVKTEIASRTNRKPANQRNATRARLWCRWISQNAMEVQQ